MPVLAVSIAAAPETETRTRQGRPRATMPADYELKDDALILSFTRQQDGAANTLTFKRISFANK